MRGTTIIHDRRDMPPATLLIADGVFAAPVANRFGARNDTTPRPNCP
jgi:hypothetical protein